MRQLQGTVIKDLNRKVKERDSEIEVLKDMIKSVQIELKGKENECFRLMKKINRMVRDGFVEKMFVEPSPSRYH